MTLIQIPIVKRVREKTDQATWLRIRAACCDESPLSAEELDEHAARVVLDVLRARKVAA